jgi:hypothetical protein
MARSGGDELLLAGVLEPDGAACRNRQVGGDVFDHHFLLAAKATADTGFDDADAFDGETKNGGKDAPGVERNLGGSADRQAVVFIPVRDDDVGFDVGLLDFGDFVFLFKYVISFGEAMVYIADVYVDVGGEVAVRVGVSEVDVFRFVVEEGGVVEGVG